MNAYRITASLAFASVAATVALSACDRTNTARQQEQPTTVGQKLDSAIDRTQQKIAEAGDKASQQLTEAGQKTGQALTNAGEKIAETTHEAVGSVKSTLAADSSVTTTTTTTTTATGDAPSRVNDAAITASIKTDLLKDPDLSVLKIDVDTKSGVVTLNGLASDEPSRQRAEKMASAVKGVKEVRNFLVVKRA